MLYDLSANCEAHYKFNDDAADTMVLDSSGNGHHGTAQRNTNLLHTDGKVGGALSFNGTGDTILVDTTENPIILNLGFSWSFWIKTNFVEIDFIDFQGGPPLGYYFIASIIPDVGYVSIRAEGGDDIIGSISIIDNLWHFIVVTFNLDGTFCLYVDNHFDGSSVGEYPFLSGLMVQTYAVDGNYIGLIDNITIHNEVFSIDKIAFLWNDGKGTEELVSDPIASHSDEDYLQRKSIKTRKVEELVFPKQKQIINPVHLKQQEMVRKALREPPPKPQRPVNQKYFLGKIFQKNG